jgi:transposase-like protein
MLAGSTKASEVMMAKCPQCKQTVTLERTNKEVANASDDVHKDVIGLVKKEVMYSCPHCDSVLGFGFYVGGLLTGRP